jgi:phage protein D
MSIGVNLTLYIGPTVALLAPRALMEALQSVEVSHNDTGRSGFQLAFQTGRSQQDRNDYQLLQSPLLKPFSRVMLVLTINAKAEVIMDGVITNQQFAPSQEMGGSTFTVTGEDISLLMDLEEKSAEHTNQSDVSIVQQLLANYAKYGVTAEVEKPSFNEQPSKDDRIPTQQGTDLSYIQQLASRHSFVFYVTAGPTLRRNVAYWGRPKRLKSDQRALSVNMGSYSNVNSISFQYNALAPTKLKGQIQDRRSNQQQPISFDQSTRKSPLADKPALQNQTYVRVQQFRESGNLTEKAREVAQSQVDQSVDGVITASGELDTTRYGAILRLRGLVGLRGVGQLHDGLYYIKSVTHRIRKGEYKQSFTLTREGLGANVQQVKV